MIVAYITDELAISRILDHLGLNPRTLRTRMKKLGIQRPV